MSCCSVCDCQVQPGERGFTPDDELVHRRCFDYPEVPCEGCNLIHKGICT